MDTVEMCKVEALEETKRRTYDKIEEKRGAEVRDEQQSCHGLVISGHTGVGNHGKHTLKHTHAHKHAWLRLCVTPGSLLQ